MSEILAPCGSYEALSAAVNAGADAVYLGEENFSARKNAQNFDFQQLCEAVKLCHYSGVKVYVTLNTLIFDNEMQEAARAIENCAKADADALIIQDIGMAALSKKIAPQMPLHASTQMTVNSLEGVFAAHDLGFSRVVLGRELSYHQIAQITRAAPIETEVFVHGALCVCISGQCYMSAVLGGRSGNRGLCAQPCRLNFQCADRCNVLSLKDISLIEDLKLLEDAGVASFKIEGRMKRPEYVAGAVNACKTALQGGIPDMASLKDVFSRSGFTKGYFDDRYVNMQGVRTKEDVIAAPKALSAMKQLYHKPYKRFNCDIEAVIKADAPISVRASASDVTSFVTGSLPQAAEKRELTEDYVSTQLSKLGGTIFEVGRVSVTVEKGLSVSASELNDLRRKAVASLSEKILKKYSNNYQIYKYANNSFEDEKKIRMEFRCEVATSGQLNQVLREDEYSYIYAPVSLLDENTEDKFRIIAVPPVFLGDCEEKVFRQLKKLKDAGFEHAAAHTLSHINLIKKAGMKPHGTFRLNITNQLSLSEYRKMGLFDAVMSVELTISDAKQMCRSSAMKAGIVAYGKLPLMITRRCPINNGKPCGVNKKSACNHTITDRQGNEFACQCSDNAVEILNPDVLWLSDKQNDINSFDFVLLRFTDEEDTERVLNMYLDDKKPEGKLTRGLFYRGVK